MVFLYTFLLVVFYLIAITKTHLSISKQKEMLFFTLSFLVLCITLREGWPDEAVYTIAFERAPNLFDITFNEQPFGYAEKGYLYLASLVKFIYNDSRFYLFSMGALSMYLLYKSLTKYCVLPLLGLCDYIARFLLNRDFIQMRSSLAMLLIILAIDNIYKRRPLKYFAVVFLAYQIHTMALIAVPLYFLYKLPLNKKIVIISIVSAFVLSQTFAGAISGYVDSYSKDLNYSAYTRGEKNEAALGLANPMIYFQIAILLYFTFKEKAIKRLTPHYKLLQMAYLYSTLILILFCNYTALSGRTSTMFATVEMFILPFIGQSIPKKYHVVYYFALVFVFIYFFVSKYQGTITMMEQG